MKKIIATLICIGVHAANAAEKGDYLVKFEPQKLNQLKSALKSFNKIQVSLNELGFNGWAEVIVPASQVGTMSTNTLSNMPGVLYVQPNYKIRLLDQPGLNDVRKVAKRLGVNAADLRNASQDDCPIPGMCGGDGGGGGFPGMPGGDGPAADNPAIPAPSAPSQGDDPMINKQWGMLDIGAQRAWGKSRGRENIVVAVIDTGVDYTHEDLMQNLWRNKGEMGTDAQGRDKSTNGVDDDGNGYIDDLIGWDFVSNDNKPFDLAVDPFQLLLGGGNPGHGTHCAGNVAARGFNGKGISGVAPNVSIMALRFLSEKGEGTTAGAVQAIAYALRNGARVTSNSWGSEGEDEGDAENKALRDIIAASQDKGVLFVAAAGNGHNGVGYDNDTDSKPGYPASYANEIIVSVAALDANNSLGSFSNWGRKSVDIGAPGVKVYSTTVGSHYSDTVVDLMGMVVTWDGTSMATPHVAGAAALYLSQFPSASWQDIKNALLKSAKPIPSLNGKTVSGGKLNVEALLQ